MKQRQKHATQAGGFTLVELLVGITLVAMIVTLAYGGVRLSTRSWDKAESVIAASDEMRLANGFIRAQLAQARPIPLVEADGDRIAFQGEPHRVIFIAPMPVQRRNIGMLYLFSLGFRQEANQLRLEVGYTGYFPDTTPFPGTEAAASSILVDKIETGEIAYFGVNEIGEPPRWHDRWERRDALPELVRFRLRTADRNGSWPDLVVPMEVGR